MVTPSTASVPIVRNSVPAVVSTSMIIVTTISVTALISVVGLAASSWGVSAITTAITTSQTASTSISGPVAVLAISRRASSVPTAIWATAAVASPLLPAVVRRPFRLLRRGQGDRHSHTKQVSVVKLVDCPVHILTTRQLHEGKCISRR